MTLDDAITQHFSCRAYLDKPVPQGLIREVLEVARHAPSSTNMQPWQVAVIQGDTKQRIGDAMSAARQQGSKENPDFRYYPDEWFEPYQGRRKATGLALYRALGIGKDDPDGRMRAWCNNYQLFGAPVGLLVFLDKRLNEGSLADIGIFIQNLVLAARARGLDSCIQASLGEYPDIAREILGLEGHWALFAGLALGYGDHAHPVNQYRTARAEVEQFTHWYD